MIQPVLFCIARYEKPYIRAWVDYHLKIGFCMVYIHDNEDIPVYADMFRTNKRVKVFHTPGPKMALQVLHQFTKALQSPSTNCPFTHAMHLDCDEFLVIKDYRSVGDLIEDRFATGVSALAINWRMAASREEKTTSKKEVLADHYYSRGDRIKITRSDGLETWHTVSKDACEGSTISVNYCYDDPLPVRFCTFAPQNSMNMHVKTIFKIGTVLKWPGNSHFPVLIEGHGEDTHGKEVTSPFADCVDDRLYIAHYKFKTQVEYDYMHVSLKRVRPDNGEPSLTFQNDLPGPLARDEYARNWYLSTLTDEQST